MIKILLKHKPFLLILLLALLIRFVPLTFGTDSQADMVLYKEQAEPVLHGLNIYRVTHGVFPYSPFSMFIPALCLYISQTLHMSFQFIMKIPAVIGDLGILISLYFVMRKVNKSRAILLSLIYAVNPLSVLIVSFQGNMMSLATLFNFLSYVFLFKEKHKWKLSAVFLCLAIGFRGYPILLLPIFLAKIKMSLKNKILYIVLSLLPVIVSFVPFLITDYKSVFREVLGYGGFTDFGYGAIWRSFLAIRHNYVYLALTKEFGDKMLFFSKIFFFLSYILILLLSKKRKTLNLIISVFLAFFVTYAGVGAQYLIWVLPFIFVQNKKNLIYSYILLSGLAVFSFYLLYHPAIIFGIFEIPKIQPEFKLRFEFISILFFWLACAFWLIKNVVYYNKISKNDNL